MYLFTLFHVHTHPCSYVPMSAAVPLCRVVAQVRQQLLGVGSLFLACGSWIWNSSFQLASPSMSHIFQKGHIVYKYIHLN